MSIFFPTSRKSGSTMDLIHQMLSGYKTATGKTVNSTTAMQVAAVFAVCRVIGEGVAQVPLKLMKKTDRYREEAISHGLYDIMGTKPNEFQTSFEYREMLAWHVVLTGNHYSFINRGSRGRILELLPFEPSQVTPKRDTKTWALTYEVQAEDGSIMKFPKESIWHVKGPSWDGWQGLECVKIARDAVGLAMATEEASGKLHRNGANPSGVYSVEGTLNDDQYKSLAAWVHQHVSGSENYGKPLILDRAGKWTQTSMTSADAQSLETRRFQIEEVCRFARVSPIMVYGSDKASTYAGSEQNFLAHLVHTLSPWYERLEQSMIVNLLTDKERAEGYYFNFIEEGLLRASSEKTKDILLGYVNGGLMTPNEGRAKLDLPPDADPESDELRIPANIVGEVPDSNEPPPDNPPNGTDTEKAIDSLTLEIKSLRDRPLPERPINITMPEMKAADVSMTSPSVTIHMPEMKAGDVHMDAPIVNVTTPEVKSGDVIVNVPEMSPNITVQPADVTISLPKRQTDTVVTGRDSDGLVKTVVQVEKDI